MAIYKCKMCSGELEVTEGVTVIECEYCGTKQTVPTSNDENLQGLFNRANTLRIKSEFDKAESIYEKILQAKADEAEAYWGLILCKYGIEYVEDPKTFKRIPTCHRTSFDSIIADDDYKSAIQYADSVQRELYETEAKEIDRLQKEILALSQKEDPYDVFICYKETDESGQRTQDSVIANDIYYQLTQEGFKVFYAAITLEDKLGSAYEPCIFAALNSAKVLLSIGTKPEYFNAVWVKNEWSRYLQMMKKDRSKMLIPCYKDMDAYELPEEFAHLQAQDMSKIGFINDLVRGIKKVIVKNDPKPASKETVIVNGGNVNVSSLLKRAFIFLEDGNWQEANAYCEKVLDQDPENAMAYVGKLMSELRVNKIEQFPDQADPFDEKNNYQKAIRFADESLRKTLADFVAGIKKRNEDARLDSIYVSATKKMTSANSEQEYLAAAETFEKIANWRDSVSIAKDCREKAEVCRKNDIYNKAKSLMNSEDEFKIKQAIPLFESIEGWLDADDLVRDCPEYAETARKNNIYNKAISIGQKDTVESITEAIGILQGLSGWKDSPQKVMDFEDRIQTLKQLEEERKAQEAERKAEEERIAAEIELAKAKKKKKTKRIAISVLSISIAVIAFITVLTTVIIPPNKYNRAIALLSDGNRIEAARLFSSLGDYKDSRMQANKLWDIIAQRQKVNGSHCAIGIQSDGLLAESKASDYYDFTGWSDIVEVTGGASFGLNSNGKILYNRPKDDFYYTSEIVSTAMEWTNICSISYSGFEKNSPLFGLKTDGTVVVAKKEGIDRIDNNNVNVSGWRDIIAISTSFSDDHVVGLKSDGTVVATGRNNEGQCDVSEWTDIVAIAAGASHTVGLKSNGTVVATGSNDEGQCDVFEWTDIVAIAAGWDYTVGLKSDGSVVMIGSTGGVYSGRIYYRNISDWANITSIYSSTGTIFGVKTDGTVVATGRNDGGQCNVSDWTDIAIVDHAR